MPAARLKKAPGLQIHPVANGYVVHQTKTNDVHHLNPTAALLFELCNGQATDEEVVRLAASAFGLAGAETTVLREALAALVRNGVLLQDIGGVETPAAPTTTSRAASRRKKAAAARRPAPRRSSKSR